MPTGKRPAPPDDSVRLVISGTNMGAPTVNVMWLNLVTTSRAQADLNSILASFLAAMNTACASRMTNVSSITSVEGIWVTPGGGEIIGTSSAGFSGTISSAALQDRAACWLINWRLNAYYRGGHPRTYLGGVAASEVTNGATMNATDVTNFSAALLTFLNAVNALTHGGITGVTLGTVSFAHANGWRSPPIFRGFTGVAVSPLLATQRRRIGR